MYNRYFENEKEYNFEPINNNSQKTSNDSGVNQKSNTFSALGDLFSSLKMPQMTVNTVVLIAIVYFLLDGEDDNDIFVIIGILLLLGI